MFLRADQLLWPTSLESSRLVPREVGGEDAGEYSNLNWCPDNGMVTTLAALSCRVMTSLSGPFN